MYNIPNAKVIYRKRKVLVVEMSKKVSSWSGFTFFFFFLLISLSFFLLKMVRDFDCKASWGLWPENLCADTPPLWFFSLPVSRFQCINIMTDMIRKLRKYTNLDGSPLSPFLALWNFHFSISPCLWPPHTFSPTSPSTFKLSSSPSPFQWTEIVLMWQWSTFS